MVFGEFTKCSKEHVFYLLYYGFASIVRCKYCRLDLGNDLSFFFSNIFYLGRFFLFQFNYMLHRCEHVCDTVIRLQSLVNEGNPAYSDYSGLLILEKLPIINSWNSYIPETNDWAFTLKKRKHFLIEVNTYFSIYRRISGDTKYSKAERMGRSPNY